MFLKNDTLILTVSSVLIVLLIILFPTSPVRVLLGFPFVLFFPGYSLIAALFPVQNDLSRTERLSLSVGLSLAIVPLLGLALNYTPWGIRLYPIIFSIFTFTLLLSIIANYRCSKLPREQHSEINVQLKISRIKGLPKVEKIFLLGFTLAIVVVSGLTVYIASAPKIDEQFTEFYMLGINGELADYPVNLTLGDTGVIIVGLTNHEYETVNYTLIVRLNNQTIQTIDNIFIDHKMNWTQNCSFTPTITGKLNLDLQLYKNADFEQPYRSLKLWVNVYANELAS